MNKGPNSMIDVVFIVNDKVNETSITLLLNNCINHFLLEKPIWYSETNERGESCAA